MSRPRLAKKLQPAKKAWRSLSNKIQSKVNELNIHRAIRTTIQRLVSTFHSFRHFITTKALRRRHPPPLPTRPYSHYNNSSTYQHVHQQKNFSAIRIDDLFADKNPASSSSSSFSLSASSGYVAAKGEMRNRGKTEMESKDLVKRGESSNNGLDTLEDAWKVVVAKSPNLQVDEKAEEFIKKFHEDMKLQKERSLLEFQERLARST